LEKKFFLINRSANFRPQDSVRKLPSANFRPQDSVRKLPRAVSKWHDLLTEHFPALKASFAVVNLQRKAESPQSAAL
jgi:hypothetical protein